MKDLLNNQVIEPRQRNTRIQRQVATFHKVKARILVWASLTGVAATAVCLALFVFIPTPSIAETPKPIVADLATGSGYIQPSRESDMYHTVAEGESLSEIAYLYNIDPVLLAKYNKINNPARIHTGQKILVPSRANEEALRLSPSAAKQFDQTVTSKSLNGGLRIRADRQFDGNAVTAHFSVDQPQDKTFVEYKWDLGNGKLAFRPNTYWSYETPGTYAVKLHVRDQKGNLLNSNILYIDVPHPASFRDGKQHFITLNGTQDSFKVEGQIKSVNGFDSLSASPISKVGEDGNYMVYQASKPGYYGMTITSGDQGSTLYLFVSPIRSIHSDRTDINWYRTQFNTGTLSNCGPTTVSMAYAWARGDYLPVSTVRQAVGWHRDGSTSFEELDKVLKTDGIDTIYTPARTPRDLFQIIDRQNIAIALINAGGISGTNSQERNLFGRYYTYVGGHYIILKGYSEDHRYVIVYDPIPSDWSSNSFRWLDGISMIGRNRYYPVNDLLSSLRRSEVLEISR